jgi:hypothetical protein
VRGNLITDKAGLHAEVEKQSGMNKNFRAVICQSVDGKPPLESMRRIQNQSHQFHGSQQQANHQQRTPRVKLGI